MKHLKHPLSMLFAVGLLCVSAHAHAHISYGELGTLSHVGDAASVTKNSFTPFGWVLGTNDSLGDSHRVAGATGFFTFSLTQAARVEISVSAATAAMNPALSVYAGRLPSHSHDYDAADPTINVEFFSNGATLYRASPMDMAPGDPQISRYIPESYDDQGRPNVYEDPVTATLITSLVENPEWTVPNLSLGGLTPEQWYAQHYTPHNGYRDTLNFTVQNGLRLDPDLGWIPDNSTPDGPYNGFWGQFDPFGDWSMANADGDWSKVFYISSVSATPCAGPNCASTLTGGFLNPGHFTGNNTAEETMVLDLFPGNYMIAADGEACANFDPVASCRQIRNLSGTVSARVIETLAPVPLPGAMWLFGSALVGLGELARRKMPASS